MQSKKLKHVELRIYTIEEALSTDLTRNISRPIISFASNVLTIEDLEEIYTLPNYVEHEFKTMAGVNSPYTFNKHEDIPNNIRDLLYKRGHNTIKKFDNKNIIWGTKINNAFIPWLKPLESIASIRLYFMLLYLVSPIYKYMKPEKILDYRLANLVTIGCIGLSPLGSHFKLDYGIGNIPIPKIKDIPFIK